MYKNVAGQRIIVEAREAGVLKAGDAANITAYLDKDGGGAVATDDTNPTELDAANMTGLYAFTMTKAESNADLLTLSPVSSTSDVTLEAVAIYTITAHTLGIGAITWTYTVTSSEAPNNPIADVDVWVTSDIGGTNVLASDKTDANGVVTFFLDAGTVYVWKQKSGQNDDQGPDTEVVS